MSIAQCAKGLPATKWNTLRLLAGVYDPLGLISPVTVSVKIISQEICRQKCEWDEQLEGGAKKGVEDWIKGLIDCHRIDVKHCVYDHFKVDHNIQLDSLTINLANINIVFHSSTLYFVSRSLKL